MRTARVILGAIIHAVFHRQKKKIIDVCKGSNYHMRMEKTQLFPKIKLKRNQFGNISQVKHFFLLIPDDSVFLHEGKGESSFVCYDSEWHPC